RVARLRGADVLEQLGDEADVVIEAALESLPLKQTIFRALDSVADPAVILATNTSALSVAEIAAATARRERVVGLHFFNPAPIMPLVEVVAAPETSERVVEGATQLVSSWGRTAVRAADAPGFIVNRVNRPFTIEALRILEEGSATVEAVDDAMRGVGFPLGPFELMDLTGLDVTTATATGIWNGLGQPDRLRPSPIQAELVEAGRLGRKTGEGFYRYVKGRRDEVAARFGEGGVAARSDASHRADRSRTLDPGAIRRRILDAIDAEARRAADEGVATPDDIDLALRLGASHPEGPFERMAAAGRDRR
ncbi:MAG TPA: 3-hydroxyacyl-CoA dehydrogenase family protein, partial [Candidatus Limnocylindrales bacterium]|nr:3-hydroxyacyl-CoA dehydrogenase family protein [Candidatus Limnocylindrales bacterium]